jgi:hypothetical protein
VDKSNYSLLLNLFGLVKVLDGFGLKALFMSSLILGALGIRLFMKIAGK